MIPCPVCSMPMPPRNPWGHRRITCSRSCGISQGNTKRRPRIRELDEVVVERLIAGDPVSSTKAERMDAVRRLSADGQSEAWIGNRFAVTPGRSASWIAAHLHIAERSVTRYRAELNTRREVA